MRVIDQHPELDLLLSRLTEGELAPDERLRLCQLVKSDAAMRARYIHYCQIHAMLRDAHGLLASWGIPDEPSSSHPGGRVGWGRKSIARSLAWSVAAAVLLVAAFMYQVLPTAEAPERGAEVAWLQKQVGTRFAYGIDGTRQIVEGTRLPQGLYELEAGVVEVGFPSGAVLTIEAPAAFRLESDEHVALESGKLAAHVPEEARGFKIDTPGGLVIDLGTEFAIEARRKQESEVHVFRGEVQINLRGSKVAKAAPLHLTAGEAAKIDFLTGVPAGIDLDEQRFLRRLDVQPSQYAQHVLKLDPVIYYPMEPVGTGNKLVDASASAADATLHLGRATHPVWSSGKVGLAFELGGPSQQTYAAADRYPQADGDELTVVAWVRADARPRWASIAKNWAGADDRGQFHFGLYGDSGELEAHIQDSSGEEIFVKDDQPLPLHAWHHVSFVADGAMLKLYRNGREIDSAPYHRLYRDERIKALGIGTKLSLQGDAPEERDFSMWDGRLDELAIFNYALMAEQIQKLYDLGASGSDSEAIPRIH
jgi:hypothetical protein